MRLAGPGGDELLALGALSLGPGEGLAWVEMARGLLVHRVRLEDSADGPRLADARVLAPTEWNVHPAGTLARALEALDPADAASAARLAVAFDPCVAFDIAPPHEPAGTLRGTAAGSAHNGPMTGSKDEDQPCTS
jgi:hypothetical protein